jgi:YVTN family beta-propeller protein
MPTAIAIDSAANRTYVTNYVGNSVSIIDGANDAVLATIPVGARPQAIAVDSTTHTVYAANTGGHSVSVISGKTNNVVGTVDVGAGPYSVAVSNGLAYVKRLGDDALLAIDPKALSAIRVDAR